MIRTKTTAEQRAKLLATVSEYRNQGLTTESACRKAGVNYKNYYNWVVAAKKKKNKTAQTFSTTAVTTLPTVTEAQNFVGETHIRLLERVIAKQAIELVKLRDSLRS